MVLLLVSLIEWFGVGCYLGQVKYEVGGGSCVKASEEWKFLN